MTPAAWWMRRSPDCRRVARILQSYLDGELPEHQHHLVAEHLRHCDRCGIDARVYREVKRSLQAMATAPDHLPIARLRTYAARIHEDEVDRDPR